MSTDRNHVPMRRVHLPIPHPCQCATEAYQTAGLSAAGWSTSGSREQYAHQRSASNRQLSCSRGPNLACLQTAQSCQAGDVRSLITPPETGLAVSDGQGRPTEPCRRRRRTHSAGDVRLTGARCTTKIVIYINEIRLAGGNGLIFTYTVTAADIVASKAYPKPNGVTSMSNVISLADARQPALLSFRPPCCAPSWASRGAPCRPRRV